MTNSHPVRMLALAALLVVGAFVLALFSPAFPQEPEAFCPGYGGEETTWTHTEFSLWPPRATRCDYSTPSGAVHHSTYFDLAGSIVITLLIAGALLAFTVGRRSLPRGARTVYAAAALVGTAAMLVLIGPYAGIVLPPLLIASALAIPRSCARTGACGGEPGGGRVPPPEAGPATPTRSSRAAST